MRKFIALMALFSLLSLALAGCGAQQVSAQDIVQKIRDTAASTTDAHIVISGSATGTMPATATTKSGATSGAFNGQATVEIWLKKPNLVKIQITSASDDKINGAEILHDGTDFWAYLPSSKMAYKVSGTAIRGLTAQANIPADIQDLVENPNLEDVINRIMDLTDYTLLGQEKVGSFDTYKLQLKPKASNAAVSAALSGVNATIWVDQKTWAIVKAEGSAQQASANMQVSTLDINSGIADSEFQFSLPNGGHVIDLSSMVPQSMTIIQARAAAQAEGWSLLEPGYTPTGATLVQVMGSKGGIMGKAGSYVLTYSGDATSPNFWISESKGGAATESDKQPTSKQTTTKQVDVNGAAGQLTSDSDGKISVLTWQDAKSGVNIEVGGQISESELLKVAQGLR